MRNKTIGSLISIFALILCLNFSPMNTMAIVKQKVIVKSVSNISVTLKQGDNFTPPSDVNANMSDGSTKRLKVIWDKVLDTSQIGAYTMSGSVSGYKNKIVLNLEVNNFISQIDNLELSADQNSSISFPQNVEAHMSNGDISVVPIKWSSEGYDNSQIGVYTFAGKVDGYDKEVYLKVTIKSIYKTTREIALYKNSVVTILSIDDYNNVQALGSGFLISKDGLVVTCYHVIDGSQNCRVVLENGKQYDLDYVANYDKKNDIAILKLKDSADMPYLNLGDSDGIEVGEDMVAIGSPAGYQNTVSSGIVSGKDRVSERRDGKDIQFTAGVTSGSSGGAVFNMKGEVIGMVYAGYSSGNLSMAVPTKQIKALLESTKKTSLLELNPLSKEQVYELQLQKRSTFKINDKEELKPTEIYVDLFKDDNEVDVTLNYHNDNYDDFIKKIYNPINSKDDTLKGSYETWLNSVYQDVKNQYPDMDVYGYIDGQKSFGEKTEDKSFDSITLDKTSWKWIGYVSLGSFGENEKNSGKDKKFSVTWKVIGASTK